LSPEIESLPEFLPDLLEERIVAIEQPGELPQEEAIEGEPDQQLIETIGGVGEQALLDAVPQIAERGDQTGAGGGDGEQREKEAVDHNGIEEMVPGRSGSRGGCRGGEAGRRA